MPIYTYACVPCGITGDVLKDFGDDSATLCPECTAVMSKRFSSFSVRAGLQPHFNVATGTYISSDRQLKARFSELSDKATERTGIEQRFVPVDPRDRDECGVTDEGLEETYRRQHDAGRITSKKVWL